MDDILQKFTFTDYRDEVATLIIPILARYFVQQWGHDDEFRKRLAAEVESYLAELQNPQNGIIIAWDGKKLAGTISIDGTGVIIKGGWIRWFIVDEQYRKSGLGRLLFKKGLEYCISRGFWHAVVSTYKGKDPAICLYEQAGFSLLKEEDFSTQKTHITKLWYQKAL